MRCLVEALRTAPFCRLGTKARRWTLRSSSVIRCVSCDDESTVAFYDQSFGGHMAMSSYQAMQHQEDLFSARRRVYFTETCTGTSLS